MQMYCLKLLSVAFRVHGSVTCRKWWEILEKKREHKNFYYWPWESGDAEWGTDSVLSLWCQGGGWNLDSKVRTCSQYHPGWWDNLMAVSGKDINSGSYLVGEHSLESVSIVHLVFFDLSLSSVALDSDSSIIVGRILHPLKKRYYWKKHIFGGLREIIEILNDPKMTKKFVRTKSKNVWCR